MILPPLRLLLTGAVMLTMCGGAALLLDRSRAAASAAARGLLVLGPYRREAMPRRDPMRTLREHLSGPGVWLARMFGVRLKRREDDPLHWGVVIAGALLAAALACWLTGLMLGLPLAWLIPPAWVLLSRTVFAWFIRRRRGLLYNQFPDALAMVVRALRVGQTVTQALRGVARDMIAPTSGEFQRLADRLAIGVPLAEALSDMGDESGLAEYRFFATTLLLQSQTGGSLTEALDGLATVIRGRVTLRRRAYALASEARTSANILAVLPVLTGGALVFVNPAYARLLIDDPFGRKVLATAVGMLLMGVTTMNVMIRRILK
jgi:tight adherence protein B